MTTKNFGDAQHDECSAYRVDTLVHDHAQALLAYAESLLKDRHCAEDIVQEALIRAWQHDERLRNTDRPLRGWLFTVTHNLIVDRMRSATFRREAVGAETHVVIEPDYSDAVLTSIGVTNLLRRLSYEHREVIMHTYIYGRTMQETARIVGVPLGTVKSRHFYALNALRKEVGGGFAL